jgi:hypothetical protein
MEADTNDLVTFIRHWTQIHVLLLLIPLDKLDAYAHEIINAVWKFHT